MIFNAIVALLVVIIPIIWSTKGKGYGMFSAFLAAVCTIVAGAIAFAAWEPLSYAILGFAGEGSGFLNNVLQGSAWTIGLLAPFVVSVLVLRLLVDSFVGANLDFSENVNLAGGIVFGAVCSVISVGMTVTAVGFLRLPSAMMGYAPIEERNGNPVYASRLWIPVDEWTVSFYENLSRGTFSTSTALATHFPRAHEAAGMQRLTYRDASRNTILPSGFEIVGRYKVAGTGDAVLTDSFLVDASGQSKKQTVMYPDGEPPESGFGLEGFVITFKSSAKEKGGNVVITPGQLRLLCELEDGSVKAIHPIAVVAPPEAGAGGLYRFRFDTKESFIASQGGGAEATFAFEFVVPANSKPFNLFVKNTRVDVSPEASIKELAYGDVKGRDAAVNDGSILRTFGAAVAGGGGEKLETAGSVRIEKKNNRFEDIELGNQIPNDFVFNKSNRGGLELNAENQIVDGEHTFDKKMLSDRIVDKNLKVDEFAVGKDVGLVKVRLSNEGARSLYGRSVETAESILLPVLIDDKGNRYEPVGYVFAEGETVKMRYTPGNPLRALSEAPALSRTKRDQTLYLLFRPTKGAKIVSFALGSKEVASFPDGLIVNL